MTTQKTTIDQLRDLRRRIDEIDPLRWTVDHAADLAALDALLGAADALDEALGVVDAAGSALLAYDTIALGSTHVNIAPRGTGVDGYTKAVRRLTAARARIDAILRGEL